jgi:hypothetical protein
MRPHEAEYARCAEHQSFVRWQPVIQDTLLRLGPLVDVGAGNGWWAKTLTDAGADVVVVEPGVARHPCFPTVRADHRAIRDHPDRALVLMWPTKGDGWAADCVRRYQGHTVVYVGDLGFRETATVGLLFELQRRFTRVEKVLLHSWPHMFKDYLTVWRSHNQATMPDRTAPSLGQ